MRCTYYDSEHDRGCNRPTAPGDPDRCWRHSETTREQRSAAARKAAESRKRERHGRWAAIRRFVRGFIGRE